MTDDPAPPPESAPDSAAQDVLWMQLIKRGDTDALREFIEAHQHRITGAIAKMLGGETDAEDLAQTVFIRVWKNAPRWQPTAKDTTWLYKIARNLVFNEIRRRSRHHTQSLDHIPGASGDDRPMQLADDSVKAPDTSLLDAEMQAAIQAAIDTLPETQRMAVILRRYDDVPYEDIAEILGLSVPAVKSVLFRARTDLREKLRLYLES